MANHPSALKRERQAQKRRLRNRAVNSEVRTAIKKVTSAISEKETNTVKVTLKESTATLDRAASKGVIPKRRASRKVSRLTKKANSLILPPAESSK